MGLFGAAIAILLFFTALAEWLYSSWSRQHRRVRQLKNVRISLAIIIVAFLAWWNWDASSVPALVVCSGVPKMRLFLVTFSAVVMVLAVTAVLEPVWPSLRKLLVVANALVWIVFALIAGATIDWRASPPTVYVFLSIAFATHTASMWKLTDSVRVPNAS